MEGASEVPRTVDTLTFQSPLSHLIFPTRIHQCYQFQTPPRPPFSKAPPNKSDKSHTHTPNEGEIKQKGIKYCILKISGQIRLLCLFNFFFFFFAT